VPVYPLRVENGVIYVHGDPRSDVAIAEATEARA
jgi:hypothetical protein